MVTYTYDYSFLLETIKYIFLPILVVVTIIGFIVFMYSRNTKKDNIEKYNYIIDMWTTLLAITIIGALFALTLGFSLSLSKTIKTYDLIKGHEIIYYLVLATPVVPFVFLFIYVYKFILTVYNKPKEEKKEEPVVKEEPVEHEDIDENYDDDYHMDFTKFNEEKEEVKEEISVEENSEDIIEEKQDEEESIHIDDLPDKVVEENHDDIELL